MSHLEKKNIPFFNEATFFQLKDAASVVSAREKSTSLAELFSVELKFTVETLNDWFTKPSSTSKLLLKTGSITIKIKCF